VTIAFAVNADVNIANERMAQLVDPIVDRVTHITVKRFKCVAQGQSGQVQVPSR